MKNTTFDNSEIHKAVTWLLISLFLLQLPNLAAAQRDGSPHEDEGDDNHAFDMQQPFNPSMAIIMIIVVSIFFCFGCLCVYIRRCAERRLSRNFNPASNFLRMQVPHGLDPEVIKTFPTFQYKMVKSHKIGKRALECAVCLNEFQDDETLRLLPKCSHVFHPDCIDAWLAFHTTCPVCRANLVPHPGDQPYAPLLAFDQSSSPTESDQPENQTSLNTDHDQARAARSPQVSTTSPIRAPLQSCSPIWSDGLKLNRLFPRSNSTGHSLVQPGADVERFTLRLPEDVRIQLMSTPLKRTRSFPRMKSPISGFKIGRQDRWGFSVTPPFIIKGSSAKSPYEGVTAPSPPKISIKSAALKLLQGTDSVGEKSSDKPRADSQV